MLFTRHKDLSIKPHRTHAILYKVYQAIFIQHLCKKHLYVLLMDSITQLTDIYTFETNHTALRQNFVKSQKTAFRCTVNFYIHYPSTPIIRSVLASLQKQKTNDTSIF